jgi:2-C-methyl-D-erythritol 4-phosphate cytidylyltransferase
VRVAATVAADARGVSVLSSVRGVPMLARAVRAVLDSGVAARVTLDVPEPDDAVLGACAGLPVAVARPVAIGPVAIGPVEIGPVAIGTAAIGTVGTHRGQRATSGDDSVTLAEALPVAVILRHDARHPLTPPALVAAVVAAVAAGHDAAVPVLPLTDTVKCVDPDGRIRDTPDRSGLRVVQAPRAWRAGASGSAVTHAVPGDPRALCVRTEWDLQVAELLA